MSEDGTADSATAPPASPASPASAPPAEATLADLVSTAAVDVPDAVALVHGDVRLTWAALEEEVARVAHGLVSAGVVAGHRVALAMVNRPELVVSYLAVLRVQAVAVPLNPRATGEEVARMLADSGARMVLVDDPPLVDPERLATLLYTSGASGRPRAVMLSHRALLANVEQVARVEPPMIGPGDVVLGALPLFHVYGLNAVLGGVLRHRATLVLVDAYDPDAVLDLVAAEGVTVLPVAPTVVGHLLGLERLAERLAPVRLVLSGSAPLDADQVAAFHEATGIVVHQGYGLTEAAPVVTSTLCIAPADDGEEAGPVPAQPDPASVGTALPGVEVRLVDDHGRTPERGDPGQVSIRGANLFSGYWPDGDDAPDEDGWWATGDVGFLAPDGQLFLVDRVKELVIVSGFSVYPTEIEDVIEEVPGVREVAVIGVPDEDTGEAVVAYVVAPDQDPETVEAAVRARCVVRLARFKQPRRIEVVDALPHTVTGKVRKGSLRAAERRRHLELL